MRKIAKEIAKTNIEDFLEYSQDKYYEEIMIQGLVISHIKDEKLFNKYFEIYINKIDYRVSKKEKNILNGLRRK